MNKYQEALDFLLNISKEQYRYFTYDKSKELLQELVEKATPKKPSLIKDSYDDFYLCGVCGCVLNYKRKYCSRCGQALDWGEEDDC